MYNNILIKQTGKKLIDRYLYALRRPAAFLSQNVCGEENKMANVNSIKLRRKNDMVEKTECGVGVRSQKLKFKNIIIRLFWSLPPKYSENHDNHF